jgi:hypothetical protein
MNSDFMYITCNQCSTSRLLFHYSLFYKTLFVSKAKDSNPTRPPPRVRILCHGR